jgi:hypothetical protein
MREQHFRARDAWALQELQAVKIATSAREECHCVLSPEWEQHFRAKASQDGARFVELEREMAMLQARVREIKRELAEGPRQLLERYHALTTTPPQGVFNFQGTLMLLPETKHTILLAADGSPIWETFRKATGEEIVEADRIAERKRQLSMFPPEETGLESQSELEADALPASGAESPVDGDSDGIPF